MRVKIEGRIINKTNIHKRNYTHGIYSMLVQHLSPETAMLFHQKNKSIRLLTFTNLYMLHTAKVGSNLHFYLGATDEIVNQLIQSFESNRMIQIEDMLIQLTKIIPLEDLQPKDIYHFKSKVIINIPQRGETRLLDNIIEVEERLRINALKKAKLLGIDRGDILIRLVSPEKHVEQYKQGHIFSWKTMLQVKGDFDVVNAIYQVGCGENTASGHGFLFEL